MKKVVLVTLTLATSLALVRAGDGNIPLFRPTAITQPGHYVLTRDISVTGGVIFDIRAGDVTLDLNGHTLSSSSTGDDLIQISAVGNPNIAILHGRFQGGRIAIHAIPPGPCKLTVQDVTIGDPGSKGIFVESLDQGAIHGFLINCFGCAPAPGRRAIDLVANPLNPSGVVTLGDGSVKGGGGISLNHVRGDLGDIYMADQTNERPVELTDASGSSIHGFVIDDGQAAPEPHLKLVGSSGVLIEGNTLRGAGTRVGLNDGIFVDASSHDVTIRNNLITKMGHDGVHLESSGNQVTGNLINGNSETGIFVAGANNLLEGNKVAGNGGAGLFFNTAGGPHVFRNNILRGNLAAVGGPFATANTDGGGNIP